MCKKIFVITGIITTGAPDNGCDMDALDLAGKSTLTICPSAQRPEICWRMIESFVATAFSAELLIYVDRDDPRVNDYMILEQKCKDLPVCFQFGPFLFLTEAFNYAADLAARSSYAFLSEVNDDHIYHTHQWDTLLANEIVTHRGGMAYGSTQHLPSAVMVSKSCIARLGQWVYPPIKHQYVDNYWRDLYGGAGMLYQVPHVNIEHLHYSFGKSQFDTIYARVYSGERHDTDCAAYHEWRNHHMTTDIEKLRSVQSLDPSTNQEQSQL
jgi:hypothetical protein